MKLNIELDDQLIKEAMELSDLKTEKAVIEEALKLLINASCDE